MKSWLLWTVTSALVLATSHPGRAQEKAVTLEKKTFTDAKGKTLPYRLMVPEKVAEGQKYPLVVFLHGAGERGTDNEKQLVHGIKDFSSPEHRKKYPCFLIAPQCPKEDKWGDWTVKAGMLPEPTEPGRLVLELIDGMVKEHAVDTKRIYITGLSMGGFGTWDLISRHPEKFAAAVPICGGGDPKQAEKIAKIPIWVFHGAKDSAVKVERSREMVEAIKKVAGNKIKYTEYPNENHASWVPAYKDEDMFKWLFEQKLEK
jgi:predicted peptidase